MPYTLGFIKQNENNFKIEDGYKYLLTLQGEAAWTTSNSNIVDGELAINYSESDKLGLPGDTSILFYINPDPSRGVAIILISEDRIIMSDAEGNAVGIASNNGTYYSIAPKKFEFNKNLSDLFPKEAYYNIDYDTNKLTTFIIKKIKK